MLEFRRNTIQGWVNNISGTGIFIQKTAYFQEVAGQHPIVAELLVNINRVRP